MKTGKLNIIKFRLEQYFPLKAFNLQEQELAKSCVKVEYTDGPPIGHITELLQGLNVKIIVKRNLSDNAIAEADRRNKIKHTDSSSYGWLANDTEREQWFPLLVANTWK